MDDIIIRPQPGPQEDFLSCTADIAIYGGAVFSGKTYAILLDPLRYIESVKKYGAVIFRRELRQVTNEGGLWDEAKELYGLLDGEAIQSPFRITFPTFGNKVEFHHLNQADDVRGWDGAQVPALLFDELQHFEESQFWYMLSRNRTDCAVKAYARATCNPPDAPGHWLRRLVDWWIGDDGWPIPERSGHIRYFLRIESIVHWAETPDELIKKFPVKKGDPPRIPKSFTFIAATMADNPIGVKENPEYAGNVDAQIESERLRMRGNWNIRSRPGELFRREDFDIVEEDEIPYIRELVRYWDRAGTLPNEDNTDPDWTAGGRVGVDDDGDIFVTDVERFRFEPQRVMKRIKLRTKIERPDTTSVLEQDPGQAGKAEISFYQTEFAGLPLDSVLKTGKMSKISVWRPFAMKARAGKVKLLRGDWNEAFILEAESVIDGTQTIHDDQIDAVAGGYMYLVGERASGSQSGAQLNVM